MYPRRRRQPVTLYTAPGCGPCKVAHAAIERAGVPARIIDRERATAAQLAEAGARAHAAGQPVQFPILTVGGQTYTGPAAALKAREIERAQQTRRERRAAKARRMVNR